MIQPQLPDLARSTSSSGEVFRGGSATPAEQDWLSEPATLEEASALYPHLSQEEALIRHQRFRLGMRWNRSETLN